MQGLLQGSGGTALTSQTQLHGIARLCGLSQRIAQALHGIAGASLRLLQLGALGLELRGGGFELRQFLARLGGFLVLLRL